MHTATAFNVLSLCMSLLLCCVCVCVSPQQAVPPGRVRYQTRLEELLFAMTYVAPPTPADTNSEGAEE